MTGWTQAFVATWLRELRAYFLTPLAYIFIAIFLISLGAFTFEIGGFLVGPLMSAVLAEFYGYRAPFVVLAVITAAFVPRIARLPVDPGSVTEERRVVRALVAQPGIRAVLICAFGWFSMIGVFEAVWAVMLTDAPLLVIIIKHQSTPHAIVVLTESKFTARNIAIETCDRLIQK